MSNDARKYKSPISVRRESSPDDETPASNRRSPTIVRRVISSRGAAAEESSEEEFSEEEARPVVRNRIVPARRENSTPVEKAKKSPTSRIIPLRRTVVRAASSSSEDRTVVEEATQRSPTRRIIPSRKTVVKESPKSKEGRTVVGGATQRSPTSRIIPSRRTVVNESSEEEEEQKDRTTFRTKIRSPSTLKRSPAKSPSDKRTKSKSSDDEPSEKTKARRNSGGVSVVAPPKIKDKRPAPSADKKITLYPRQQDHFRRMREILDRFKFFLDTSEFGTGKTYIAMKLIQTLKPKHVVYISSVPIVNNGVKLFSDYELNDDTIFITFRGLIGSAGKNPKHGLLERRDYSVTNKNGNEKKIVEYVPSDLFRRMVEEGCILIIDEVQNIKNEGSLQTKAAMALEKEVIDSDSTESRVLELSAGPVNKEDHCITLMMRFRIIKHDKLFESSNGEFELTGAQDLLDFCYNLDPVKTDEVLEREGGFTKANASHLCYVLYTDVVLENISDSMIKPESEESVDVGNGFYHLSKRDAPYVLSAMKQLENAVGFINPKNPKFTNWAEITVALRQLEITKINLFIRLAKTALTENKHCKVVLGLNYLDSIKYISDKLEKYGVVVITGSVKVKERTSRVEKFNRPDDKIRVLIGTLKIISTGIHLDDRDGNFPRFAFGSSSYNFMECHQFQGRFLRGEVTKSSTVFRYVYGLFPKDDSDNSERRILDSLSRSTKVCKATLEKQVESGVTFPGDYATMPESDDVVPIRNGPYSLKEILGIVEAEFRSKLEDDELSEPRDDFDCPSPENKTSPKVVSSSKTKKGKSKKGKSKKGKSKKGKTKKEEEEEEEEEE
jgi:hypothetical protein